MNNNVNKIINNINKYQSDIEKILSYNFKDKINLNSALLHPSKSHMYNKLGISKRMHAQRLEFLGDKILGFIISDILFNKHNCPEGGLSKIHGSMTSSESFAWCMKSIGLDKIALKIDDIYCNTRLLASLFESLIASIYIDGGIDSVRNTIEHIFDHFLIDNNGYNKTFLQEWCHSKKLSLPQYKVINIRGSDHHPLFDIQLKINGYDPIIVSSTSKKIAEHSAAIKFIQLHIKKNS